MNAGNRSRLEQVEPSAYKGLKKAERKYADRYYERFLATNGGWYPRAGEVRDPQKLARLAYVYTAYALARRSLPFAVAAAVLIGLHSLNVWLWVPGLLIAAAELGYLWVLGRRYQVLTSFFDQ